jgi:hypothetical protein
VQQVFPSRPPIRSLEGEPAGGRRWHWNEGNFGMLNIDENARLLCPACGFNCTHVDEVYVAGRPREDGDVFPVHVTAGGLVSQGLGVDLPSEDIGRRHVITLTGWCEGCSKSFAIEFKQHKGETYLKLLQKEWRPL